MRVVLSNLSGEPIYEQIRRQIEDAILSGELSENELLPSLRQLARELRISVLTTTRAYSELEKGGFIVNVPGKGCYVRPRNADFIREQQLRITEEHLREAIASAGRAGIAPRQLHEMLNLLMEDREDG